jgi:exodeoxyribonuclease VII large subunit
MLGRIQEGRRRLELLRRRLAARDPVRRVGELRTRWTGADGRLGASVASRLQRARARLATIVARLDSLSPLAVLGRGYALCWSADGRMLHREARPEMEGDQVRVTLAKGSLLCDVREATPGTPDE